MGETHPVGVRSVSGEERLASYPTVTLDALNSSTCHAAAQAAPSSSSECLSRPPTTDHPRAQLRAPPRGAFPDPAPLPELTCREHADLNLYLRLFVCLLLTEQGILCSHLFNSGSGSVMAGNSHSTVFLNKRSTPPLLCSHPTPRLCFSILRKQRSLTSLLSPHAVGSNFSPINSILSFWNLASAPTSLVLKCLSYLPTQIHVHCPAAPSPKVSPVRPLPGQSCHRGRKGPSGREKLHHLRAPLSGSVATLGQ